MEIVQNSTYVLEILVTDSSGTGIPGLSVTYAIYNSDTNLLIDSGSLTDLGTGIYKKAKLFNTLGQFRIEYTTPTNYTDEIETVLVVADLLPAIKTETDKIKYILGLVHENMVMTNQVYDVDGNLTAATIKLYNSAVEATAQVNEFATYAITASYTAGLVTHYKVVKV